MQMLQSLIPSVFGPSLESILEQLADDESRVTFLRNLYKPGRTEIADKILDLQENYTIMLQEADHALKKGRIVRFLEMAKKYVDTRINSGLEKVADTVIAWDNLEIGTYTMDKLSKVEQEDNWRRPLVHASRVAKHFGMQEKNTELLERLLELQKKKNTEYWRITETLIELDRYDEVINIYIQNNDLPQAFAVAESHLHDRVKEIAELILNNYEKNSGSDSDENGDKVRVKIYVHAAKILGKQEQAAQILMDQAKNYKYQGRVQYGYDLLKALMDLEKREEAQDFADKLEQACRAEKGNELDDYDREAIISIHETAGSIRRMKKIYHEMLNIQRIKKGKSSIEILQKAFKETGDTQFRQMQMLEYERSGSYLRAAKLAEELGKRELALTYRQMQTMVHDS